MTNPDQFFIGILGVDGVGKTTHVSMLIDSFKKSAINLQYVWFRFFHFSTLFFLFYARLRGFTRYETREGIRVGFHDFSRSFLLRKYYPWFLYFDMYLYYIVKIYVPLKNHQSIICDRYIYDTIVDLMIDLNDDNLYRKPIAAKFFSLIPENASFFLLDLDIELIRQRRTSLSVDDTLAKRREYYRNIAEYLRIPIVSNEKDVEQVQNTFISYL